MPLVESCRFISPGTNETSNDKSKQQSSPGTGQSVTSLLGVGGVTLIHDLIQSQLTGKGALVDTINQPQVFRYSNQPFAENRWKSDIELLQQLSSDEIAQPAAGATQAGSLPLFCSAWFDSYLTGDQLKQTGENESGKQVRALQQFKFCVQAPAPSGNNKVKEALKWIGHRIPKCLRINRLKPFAIHRTLEFGFHSGVMTRADLVTCSTWEAIPNGNRKLLGTIIQYSYQRQCALDCKAGTPGQVSCEINPADAKFFEYAEYPTKELVQQQTSVTGTGSAQQDNEECAL
jgi:hypothetical protein